MRKGGKLTAGKKRGTGLRHTGARERAKVRERPSFAYFKLCPQLPVSVRFRDERA